MKRNLVKIICVLICCAFALNVSGQTTAIPKQNPTKPQQQPAKRQAYPIRPIDTAKNTDPSLNGQYQFMLSKSKSASGYKLINPYRLGTLWKSVNDTLRKERSQLRKAQLQINEQQTTISTLQKEVTGKESSLNDSNAKLDEIGFLGLSFKKSTYNIIVWSVIFVLAIALFVVIARSAKNILEAKHRTQLYDEISAEYQAYKVKANEKERKLARELQDERNTIEEMRGRA